MPLPSPSLSSKKSFISAIDNIFISAIPAIPSIPSIPSIYQYGENNHIEYNKVKVGVENLKERILQFQFQLVRTNDEGKLQSVATETREILHFIMSAIRTTDSTITEEVRSSYINMGVIMFKLLAHTRDIVSGKGEYMLFYVMLLEWAKIDILFF